MARAASWATALVVAALVAVAALDAVRGGDDDDEAPARTVVAEPELPRRDELAARLRELGIGGRLVYTDERCGLHALSLPSLRETARPAAIGDSCTFSLSPDGRRAAFAAADWSPDGRFVAVCRGTIVGVYVRREIGRALQAWDGCAPAWRPDGVLTLVRRGELLEVRPGCAAPPCERVLLSRDALVRAADGHVVTRGARGLAVPAIDDVAWLSTTRVAVLMAVGLRGRLAARGPLDLVAFFQASRLLAAVSGGDDRLLRLRTASLAGELVVAWPDRLLTRSGAEVRLPDDLRGAVALALSPDERWLAVATGFELALVELPSLLARGEPLTVRLPLAARDVDWR